MLLLELLADYDDVCVPSIKLKETKKKETNCCGVVQGSVFAAADAAVSHSAGARRLLLSAQSLQQGS